MVVVPKHRAALDAHLRLAIDVLLKVVGSKKTSVIYMGDMWRPETHWDGRYLWMPVEIGGGTLHLPAPRPWSIDVKTGEVTLSK